MLLEHGGKYRIDNSETVGYKSKMQLNITRVNANDFLYLYACVSKNLLQRTRGEITIYGNPYATFSVYDLIFSRFTFAEVDSYKKSRSQMGSDFGKDPTVYGVLPPDRKSLEDLCGPPVLCPECENKCSPGGVSLIDLISHWEVRQLDINMTLIGLGKRTTGKLHWFGGNLHYYTLPDLINLNGTKLNSNNGTLIQV